jgi:hypothetical protein
MASKKAAVLLSGGNPQIPKGDGAAPVRAYLAAMPGWKKPIGKRLDAIITKTLPGVKKAVRWNSPFYGVEDMGWFLSFHCFDRYIKVLFFRGTSLKPMPPVASKSKHARYVHYSVEAPIDEKQLVKWIKQAAKIHGWDGHSAD